MESKINTIELYQPEEDPETIDFIDTERIKQQVDLIYEKMSEGIGHGKTAEVVYIPAYKTSVCYKIIADQRLEDLYGSTFDAPAHNSPKIEAYFLSRAGETDNSVKVPHPLCYWEGQSDLLGNFKVLVLEKLNAFTVQDLLMNQERLPENFDIEKFAQKLTTFVEKMNDSGIRHNDLTVTNVMIDRETGLPCVIDFGDAEKEFGEEKRPFTRDKVAVRDILAQVRNHMRHKVM